MRAKGTKVSEREKERWMMKNTTWLCRIVLVALLLQGCTSTGSSDRRSVTIDDLVIQCVFDEGEISPPLFDSNRRFTADLFQGRQFTPNRTYWGSVETSGGWGKPRTFRFFNKNFGNVRCPEKGTEHLSVVETTHEVRRGWPTDGWIIRVYDKPFLFIFQYPDQFPLVNGPQVKVMKKPRRFWRKETAR